MIRKIGAWIIKLILLAFILAAITISGLVALLATGPLELAFLRSKAVSILQSPDRGLSASVGKGSIEWLDGKGLFLRFDDIQIASEDKEFAVKVAEIHVRPISFSVNHFDLSPGDIVISDVDVAITRSSDKNNIGGTDGVLTSTSGGFLHDPEGGLEALGTAMREIAVSFDTKPKTFAANDIRLRFFTQSDETKFLYQRVTGDFSRLDDGTLNLKFGAEKNDARWFGSLQFKIDDQERSSMRLRIEEAAVSDLIDLGQKVREGSFLNVPITSEFRVSFNSSDNLLAASADLKLGAAYLKLAKGFTLLNEGRIELIWRVQEKTFEILPSSIRLGKTILNGVGEIRPPTENENFWRFIVESPNSIISPRDVEAPPLRVDLMRVMGRFDTDFETINFDVMDVQSPALALMASAGLTLTADGPVLSTALWFAQTSVETVKRVWPFFVASKARRWFLKNVESGRVTEGRILAGVGPKAFDDIEYNSNWDDEDVQIDIGFENATTQTIGALPKINNAKGSVRLIDGAVIISVQSGISQVTEGAAVAVKKSEFIIEDVRLRNLRAKLSLDLKGGAKEIGMISNSEPIAALKGTGVNPKKFIGNAAVQVEAQFPLRSKITKREVNWNADVQLKKFGSRAPIQGRKIEKADLKLELDNEKVRFTGTAQIDGLQADLDLENPIDKYDSYGSGGVKLRLTEDDLRKRGLSIGDFFSGAFEVEVLTEDSNDPVYLIDLTNTRLFVPVRSWTKGVGIAAQARFSLAENADRIFVKDFQFQSSDAQVKGTIEFDKDYNLLVAKFLKFNLQKSDRSTLKIRRSRNGRYRVEIAAKRMDGRGIIASIMRGSSGDNRGRIELGGGGSKRKKIEYDIIGKIDELAGFNDVALKNLGINASTKQGRIETLIVAGNTPAGRKFKFSMKPGNDGQRALVVTAPDLGKLLSLFDIYNRLEGGALQVNAQINADNHASGTMVIRDFLLRDRKLLEQLSVTSDRAIDNLERYGQAVLRGNAADSSKFKKFDTLFEFSGSRLALRKSQLAGVSYGGTANGEINLKRQTVDVRGTILPIYGLNNFFGKIPIFGRILGGKRGGLIGITFQLVGPMDGPVMRVNPASVIAPGVLRKIFEYQK